LTHQIKILGIKTPNQEVSAVTLLCRLVALGQIRLNKIDGHREFKALVATMSVQAR